MRKLVYIETTIPSFYYEVRTEPEMVARRHWTRQWWDEERHHYDLVTSLPVLDELRRGQQPNQADALKLVSGVPLLAVPDAVGGIVDAYIRHHVMPRDPRGDALHLAVASFHRCHFLLTWNCEHLANANKFEHIRHVNYLLGLWVPTIITPVELLLWEEGDEDDETR
ncbi:MAG: type II toxin-antitoxin system VapC family toxin [Planctomycetes bacterium]|nr:type II toxin-antitoxin system VapC family toxin [Planctomycetota bacterium]